MELMTWEATDNIDLINVPLLLIAGEKATGTNNKELYIIPGATHIKTYFVPEYVNKALDKLGDFYKANIQ